MMSDEKEWLHVEGPDDEPEPGPAAPEGWRIGGPSEADWALSRIAQAERELYEVADMEAAAIARVRARAEKLRVPLNRTVSFFTGHLRQWAEDNRGLIWTGKRKSRAFLHGRIGWRQTPLRLVVTHEGMFTAWAQASGYGANTFTPDMEAIRAIFRATGALPPGCESEGGNDEFKVITEEVE